MAEPTFDERRPPWRPAARGWQQRIGRVRGRRGLWLSATVVAVCALAAVFVPVFVPLDPSDVALREVLRPPSLAHPMGTDGLGRDVLLRCLYGLRVSFAVALLSALTATVLGTVVGAVAAAVGGWVDRLLMRLVDALGAIPHLVLGVFIVALFQPSLGAVVASIGLTHWLTVARIVRAEVLSLRERPYIDAAISGGAGRLRVLTRHLVPGVAPHALLAAALLVPHAIFHESALSFLGLGLPSQLSSLGTMLNLGQRGLLAGAWWPALFPGLCIVVATLGLAGLAGALRERMSPKRTPEAQL